MEDDRKQTEWMDDSSAFQAQSPYQSENSRYSEDSYPNQDDHMESNSYDGWEENAYYDGLDDTAYESLPLALDDRTEESFIVTSENLPVIRDINIDAMEENNNDPNNNMDSIEIIAEHPSVESRISIPRAKSPKPGCSKDSLPVLSVKEDSLDYSTLLERTQRILDLVSTVNQKSIMEAIKKNPYVATDDFKLSDLAPENRKFEYSANKPCGDEGTGKKRTGESSVEINGKTVGSSANNGECRMINSVKRGPVEDICTVGCKKSSSNPDIPVMLPKAHSAPSIVKNPSHIPLPTNKIIFLGKIRRDNSRYEKSVWPTVYEKQHPRSYVNDGKTDGAQFVNSGASKRQIQVGDATAVDISKGAIPKVRPETNNHRQFQQERQGRTEQSEDQTRIRSNQGTGSIGLNEHAAENKILESIVRSATVESIARESRANNTGKSTLSKNIAGAEFLIVKKSSSKQENPAKEQSTDRLICMEMYYKLRNIFPNVDPDYLKKLCPPEWGPGDRDAQFTPIVEHLLQKGDNLPLAPAQINQENNELGSYGISNTVDDVYENLLGIFPDADPHYLREFAEKNGLRPDAVKEFVESNLENRNYPTTEQYMARLKITEQQRQYTTGFDVKQYLTIIPDPFKHFLDPNRKGKHSTVAIEFLKSYFNKIKVITISHTYTRFHYNLSLTADQLERMECELKSKRVSVEIPTEDILLLQEIAFVKHKAEIKTYIDNIKKAEDMEFKMLKEQNALVACECCYDSECVPSKCSNCDNGHIFCNSCIIAGTNSKMGEGEARVSCFVNCGSEFSLSALQRVLAPTTFSILLKKRQAAEVMEAGLEGLVSCPFCHFSSIPPEEDKIFKCLNPECTKESCRLCKELSHVPLKCDEVMKTDKARHYIEERMTEALARKCYKCKRAYFKEEGCNRITCPCGAAMCYLCDQPVKDYTHFRGQGSDATNLCPLYSDTIRLNAVAVHKVAEEAQMEVMKLNPNIKIDTTKLLPNIPQTVDGTNVVANPLLFVRRGGNRHML